MNTPDHLDKALEIQVENMEHLINELEAVIERHLAEDLVTAHGILGALEDVKQRYWHRMNEVHQDDQEGDDDEAADA